MTTADGWLHLFLSNTRSLRSIAGALAVPLLLGACGGGVDSGGGNSPTPTTTAATGSVTLAWDTPTGAANVSGYRLYYGSAPGTYYQAPGAGIGTGNVTRYTVADLNRSTRVYFVVTAVDTQGNESGYSNEVFQDIP